MAAGTMTRLGSVAELSREQSLLSKDVVAWVSQSRRDPLWMFQWSARES